MRRILLNAFDMARRHPAAGLWRHPDDQGCRYRDLEYWTELARLLERGGFDAIFLAGRSGYTTCTAARATRRCGPPRRCR